MSLKVWLPLNGNLNNYGISDFKITNATAVVDTNGKIGSCYKFSSQVLYGPLNVASIFNTNRFTGAAWTYLTTTNSASYIYHLGGVSAYPNLFGLNQDNGTYRIFLYGNEIQTTVTTIINQWVHLAVTYNGTTLILFINGEQVWSQDVAISSFTPGNHLAIGARINNAQGTSFVYQMVNNSKLNDVRLYNNALTAEEIKKISQALVLHYPLNNAPLSNLHSRPSILPPEYQEVEYIESTGREYINTDWIPTVECGVIAKGAFLSYASSAPMIGSGPTGASRFFPLAWAGEGSLRFTYGNAEYSRNYTIGEEIFVTFNKPARKLYINGELKHTYGNTYTVSTNPLYLFGTSGYGSNLYLNQSRLWFVRIFDNGDQIKRNLVPCYRISDKKPGMYDTVNGVFYTNASGSGEFKCGPLIKNIPNEYMPLNYIESTGTQYLNINRKMTATSERFFITEWTSFVNGNYGFNSSGSKEVVFKINASTNQNYLGGSFNYEWFSNKIYNIYLSTISGALQLMVNGVIIRSSSGTTAGKEEYICAYISSNTANEDPDTKTKQRYWNYYIRDNGIPVRDLRPVLRINDKKPGMYDLVNDIFYTNAGTGEFLYPPLDTIYDISGFKQNGSITGDLIIAKEGPRYKKYIRYPDSACSIYIGNLSKMVPNGEFTFNIWFRKNTGEWSSKTWETILGGPGGFELESKMAGTQAAYIHPYSWGGGSTSSPNSYSIPYTLDEWHMLTMVRTNSLSKFYLDSEWKLDGTAGTIPSGNYYIGSYANTTAQNYRGYLADARIYSTALNDNDIQELYNMGRLS